MCASSEALFARAPHLCVFLCDRVKIELSPYDLDRGRITYRYK
jgi:hypothetical protein